MTRVIKSVLIVSILILVGAQPALAYIDPSTGGMLFQMLAVALASISAVLLIFSRQIRAFFARVMRVFRGGSGERTGVAESSEAPPPDSVED